MNPRKSFLAVGTIAWALSATGPLRALPYNPAQVELEPATAADRLSFGGAAWGDMDGDGDLDAVVSGVDAANNEQLRVYVNGGAPGYAFGAAQVEVFGVNNGLGTGDVALGDLNGDGRLDIVVTGNRGGAATRQILVALNNGGLTFTQVVVDPGSGLEAGEPALGDFDNDGDLDLLVSGLDPAAARQLRVYLNNGNGSFDPNQIEVPGAAGAGYATRSAVAGGDYNNDGFLDVLVCGQSAAGRLLHIFTNNGNGGFTGPLDVTGGVGGFSDADTAFGDLNNDGLLDVVAMGTSGGGPNNQLRAYRNNGNGTFTTFNIPGVVNQGIRNGALAIGDSNNDGLPDVAVVGTRPSTGNEEVWVYRNNGGFAFSQFNVESALNLGLQNGGLAWADYNGNGSPDLLITGNDSAGAEQMRLYSNSVTTAAAPTPPAVLVATFTFSETGASTATFKWDPGADAGAGATPANTLAYDLEVSTAAGFSPLVVTPLSGASPRWGNYFRPPLIYDGNTRHGVIVRSTQPWSTNNAHPGLLTDTTYYFRVRTVDAGLLASAPSATATLWTGVAPATSTLVAAAGVLPGDVALGWASAGDDLMKANLTGNFRIQYATTAATAWSTSTTPLGAFTLTVATSNVVPGAPQSVTVNLPTNDTWYFVLWSQDDVGQWSAISNAANAVPAPINRSVTIDSGGSYDFGPQAVGTSAGASTPVVIRNDGNVITTYSLSAATTTVGGSPWGLGTVTAFDTVVVFGAFHGAAPALGAFGPEDVILSAAVPADGSVYSIDGSETGAAVPLGATRQLWIRLDTPPLSSTESPQQVTVTITAGP